jgi:hypothetical protein
MTYPTGLIICWNGSQNSGRHCTHVCQFIIKADTTQEQSRGRICIGKLCGQWGGNSMLYLGILPFQLHVFTSSKGALNTIV